MSASQARQRRWIDVLHSWWIMGVRTLNTILFVTFLAMFYGVIAAIVVLGLIHLDDALHALFG